MKTLCLLRHAKSSWKDPELADHDRPLKKRGKRDAIRMGQLLREVDLRPDAIVCSTAARTRATLELLGLERASDVEPQFSDRLYECSADDVLAVASALPAEASIALLIGHNPAFEDFVSQQTGEHVRLPTGSLVRAQFDIDCWSQLKEQPEIQSVEVWRPKERKC